MLHHGRLLAGVHVLAHVGDLRMFTACDTCPLLLNEVWLGWLALLRLPFACGEES